jgi:hypothetical protein
MCMGSRSCRECDGLGEVSCDACGGAGGDCEQCKGSGHYVCRPCDGSGACPRCSGEGEIETADEQG